MSEAIVFFNSEEFFKNIEPILQVAGSNEVAILFTSLTAKICGSNSWLIYPIIFYTYPQKVSGSTVDFKCNFHDEPFQRCFNGLQNYTTQLLEPVLSDPNLQDIFEELYIIPFNTIHKHPRGVCHFSYTDHRGILNKQYGGDDNVI